MKTVELIMPNWTLSYLINNDDSGITEEEKEIIHDTLDRYEVGDALVVKKSIGFSYTHHLIKSPRAAECSVVVFPVRQWEYVNSIGLREIREFLLKNHISFIEDPNLLDGETLDRWVEAAEYHLSEHDTPTIEISSVLGRGGCPHTFTVSEKGISLRYA